MLTPALYSSMSWLYWTHSNSWENVKLSLICQDDPMAQESGIANLFEKLEPYCARTPNRSIPCCTPFWSVNAGSIVSWTSNFGSLRYTAENATRSAGFQ